MITTLFRYNAWANAQIVNRSELVSEAQFNAVTGDRNLHELLFHAMRTEWVWRVICQEHKGPAQDLRIQDFPTLSKIKDRWLEDDAHLQSFIAGLSDDDFSHPVEVQDRQGNLSSETPWQMLMHIILHSMQHRTEAAALLTDYGQSPGDLDFIFYVSP